MEKIIGLSGKIGAGKGTVAKYLVENYDAKQFVYSDILSDILKRLDLPVTRTNLQALGKGLRESLGGDVLVNAMRSDLKKSEADIKLIDGIRYLNEVVMLREFPNSVLIFVDAPEGLRYERVKSRGEKDEGEITLAQFRSRELVATEREINKVKAMSDYLVDNSGSIKSLYDTIDGVIQS